MKGPHARQNWLDSEERQKARLTWLKKLIGSNWIIHREDHFYGLWSSIRQMKEGENSYREVKKL